MVLVMMTRSKYSQKGTGSGPRVGGRASSRKSYRGHQVVEEEVSLLEHSLVKKLAELKTWWEILREEINPINSTDSGVS